MVEAGLHRDPRGAAVNPRRDWRWTDVRYFFVAGVVGCLVYLFMQAVFG